MRYTKSIVVSNERENFISKCFLSKGHSVHKCIRFLPTDCLVSGDEDGTVLSANCALMIGISDQIPNVVVKGGGDNLVQMLCTCGIILSDRVIFSIKTFEKKFEINAHARWINSMDICVKNQRLIAVSEDTCVSVWQIPRDKSGLVECLYYQAVQSYVLTGCRFLDEDGNCFALTAFDYAEVLVYQLDSNC